MGWNLESRTRAPRPSPERVLHLLASDLLEGSSRPVNDVVNGALDALRSYFELAAVVLTADPSDPTAIRGFAGANGVTQTNFAMVASQIELLEPGSVEVLLDVQGPGDVWRCHLSPDHQVAFATLHQTVTAVQITVPHGDDAELSLTCTAEGAVAPERSDLELIHNALSHISQYLRRNDAEEQIRRHGALDQALAEAGERLSQSRSASFLDDLRPTAAAIANIVGCVDIAVDEPHLAHTQMRANPSAWNRPRKIDGDRDSAQWGVAVSDGIRVIGFVQWTAGPSCLPSDASDAFLRLVELVPASRARLDIERRLEAAFQNAPVGIALRDARGSLIDCNDALMKFIGVDFPIELHGSTRNDLIDLATALPDDVARLESAHARGVELPFVHRNGHTVWARVTTSMVDSSAGAMQLDHIEDITAAKADREQLDQDRSRDRLTGLVTRSALEHQLHTRLDNAGSATLMAVNLDRFSVVNDTFGFDAGDAVLAMVASRLDAAMSENSVIARGSGDEFLVLTPSASYLRSCEHATLALRTVEHPFIVGGAEIRVGASVGVCIAEGPATAANVLLGASKAAQAAKEAGRNRFVHHQPQVQNLARGHMETELRRALRNDQLMLHFQPEFDLRDTHVVGAEALVRWNHPERGLLAAGDFVPLAEEIGLSSELTHVVLEQAFCAAAGLLESHRDAATAASPLEHFKLRVNLSARDVEQPSVIDGVIAAIEAATLPIKSLCIEVTESAIMRDHETVVAQLDRLANIGVSLAIDDFGTGFSSLWLLRELPFDTLKIDQRFVASLEAGHVADIAIVETIVKLGETLGMEITAEGIETEKQLAQCRNLGITRGQGFLLARPQPQPEMVAAMSGTGTPYPRY